MAKTTPEKPADPPYLSRKDIEVLMDKMKENQLSEFEFESGEQRLHIIAKHREPAQKIFQAGSAAPAPVMAGWPAPMPAASAPAPVAPVEASSAPAATPAAPAESPTEEESSNLTPVKSPMVGTFYRAPAPGANTFVENGDKVDENSVLCIIEAMKLMNEIKAEMRGTIKKILVENAQPVEYGQTLFLIEPA